MKKYILSLFIVLFLSVKAFSAPSNTMSITPAAVDATTITASDENTRNNNISTPYNAHDHTDISQTANTLNVGDAAAGNKTVTAYNADGNKPYLRYDDTNNKWTIADDGSTVLLPVVVSGVSVSHRFLPASPAQGDILYSDGTTWQNLAKNTSSSRYLSNTGGSNNPAWAQVSLTAGVTGTLPVTNGGTGIATATAYAVICAGTAATEPFQSLASLGTSGQVLTSNGAGALPSFQALSAMQYTDTRFKAGTFTYDLSTASGTQAITGVGFAPKGVIFINAVQGVAAAMAIGLDEGTGNYSIYDNNGITTDTWGASGDNQSLVALVSSGNQQVGYISSLDAGGFTITWTKSGTPTGTLTVQYLALR